MDIWYIVYPYKFMRTQFHSKAAEPYTSRATVRITTS